MDEIKSKQTEIKAKQTADAAAVKAAKEADKEKKAADRQTIKDKEAERKATLKALQVEKRKYTVAAAKVDAAAKKGARDKEKKDRPCACTVVAQPNGYNRLAIAQRNGYNRSDIPSRAQLPPIAHERVTSPGGSSATQSGKGCGQGSYQSGD